MLLSFKCRHRYMATEKGQGTCKKEGTKWLYMSSPACENATCFQKLFGIFPHGQTEEIPLLLYVSMVLCVVPFILSARSILNIMV